MTTKFIRLKIYLQVLIAFLLMFQILINYQHPIVSGESVNSYLFLTPSMYVANEVGELFEVCVTISTVKDLQSIEFTLVYNSSLLNVTQIIQCTYFPSPPVSHFEFEKNESLGLVKVDMSLAPLETPKSGNGTLVCMIFEVIHDPETCACSPLSLIETSLLSHDLIPITHDTVGAVYFWKSLQPDPPVEGRSLDLITQKGGVGSNEQGGEFVAGDEVQLVSLVTHNAEPVQQKLVAFEVRDPSNKSVVFRIAITDQSGIAKINFRIPVTLGSNGTWIAISVVEIGEKIVWDTISFQVYLIMPVGGNSILVEGYKVEKPLSLYLILVIVMATILAIIKNNLCS